MNYDYKESDLFINIIAYNNWINEEILLIFSLGLLAIKYDIAYVKKKKKKRRIRMFLLRYTVILITLAFVT